MSKKKKKEKRKGYCMISHWAGQIKKFTWHSGLHARVMFTMFSTEDKNSGGNLVMDHDQHKKKEFLDVV